MKSITRLAAVLLPALLLSCTPDEKPGQEEGPAAGEDKSVFGLLDLDRPGLGEVKETYANGDTEKAGEALLDYFRTRTDILNTEVNPENTSFNADARNKADQALEENGFRFYVRNFSEQKDANGPGLDRFYSFRHPDYPEKLIDWYAHIDEVGANEFNYQRHRFQWMDPQARGYRKTGDEKYIKNWIQVYGNWLETFPVPDKKTDSKNSYQWYGLQASERLSVLIDLMSYYIGSENFTAEWLCTYLRSLYDHVTVIRANWYKSGSNIHVSQLHAVLKFCVLFPEFKDSRAWLKNTASRIASEIRIQFHDDGVHNELDPSYHMGVVSNFRQMIELCNANNVTDLNPDMKAALEHACEFIADIMYPDLTLDNFNDTRNARQSPSGMINTMKVYSAMFPDNPLLKWMSGKKSDGTGGNGQAPEYLAKAYPTGGYYMLRSSWTDPDAMMMVLKNNYNPEGKFHCQPDNGTFGLYYKGRNFFPDAGVYAYEGESTGADRERFRKTAMHNTLTFGGRNASVQEGRCLQFDSKWQPDDGSFTAARIVTENEHEYGKTHRRAVYFIDNSFFVVVDIAYGNYSASIPVDLQFHMADPAVHRDLGDRQALYSSNGSENLLLLSFPETGVKDQDVTTVRSDVSNEISVISGHRTGFRLSVRKSGPSAPVRFITVIHPFASSPESLIGGCSARFTDDGSDIKTFKAEVSVNGKIYNLSYYE